jgi:hypothetical protein
MVHLLLELIVVLAELYVAVWVISFLLGAFNSAWRWPMYPVGPGLPGSVGSLILAIAIVLVGRQYGFGLAL